MARTGVGVAAQKEADEIASVCASFKFADGMERFHDALGGPVHTLIEEACARGIEDIRDGDGGGFRMLRFLHYGQINLFPSQGVQYPVMGQSWR